MENISDERKELTRLICESVSKTLNDYAIGHPQSTLKVGDIRDILVTIIDFIDIADISGYGPWKK